MSVMERIDLLTRSLGPDGRFDPVDQTHFGEAVAWIDNDEWAEIARAYHTRDDAEFGRLLAQAAHRYWAREARHETR